MRYSSLIHSNNALCDSVKCAGLYTGNIRCKLSKSTEVDSQREEQKPHSEAPSQKVLTKSP